MAVPDGPPLAIYSALRYWLAGSGFARRTACQKGLYSTTPSTDLLLLLWQMRHHIFFLLSHFNRINLSSVVFFSLSFLGRMFYYSSVSHPFHHPFIFCCALSVYTVMGPRYNNSLNICLRFLKLLHLVGSVLLWSKKNMAVQSIQRSEYV